MVIDHDILDELKYSLVLPIQRYDYGPDQDTIEDYRDFDSTLEFDFGVSRQNRNASALWLSAYIGNYIGNCLSYLDKVLERIERQKAINGTITKLEVKWKRVALTLSGLTGFQILFVLAALFYCRESFQVVDNVSTLSAMLNDFPEIAEDERVPAGAFQSGKFISDGHGVHWSLQEVLDRS